MIYKAWLCKTNTFWWDEDALGQFEFSAENDTDAKAHVATVVERMNRRYNRMQEAREIIIQSLSSLQEIEGQLVQEEVSLAETEEPLKDLRSIRRVLESFYPGLPGEKRRSSMPLFSTWMPRALCTIG